MIVHFFCSSYGVQLSFDGMNPGLVEEGTKCGDGMVCDLQRCVSLSSQSIPTCPSAGGEQCSGPTRGVNLTTHTHTPLNAYPVMSVFDCMCV